MYLLGEGPQYGFPENYKKLFRLGKYALYTNIFREKRVFYFRTPSSYGAIVFRHPHIIFNYCVYYATQALVKYRIPIDIILELIADRKDVERIIRSYMDPFKYHMKLANAEVIKLLTRYAKKKHLFKNRTGELEASIQSFDDHVITSKKKYFNYVLDRTKDPLFDKAIRDNKEAIGKIVEKHLDSAAKIAEHRTRYLIIESQKLIIKRALGYAFAYLTPQIAQRIRYGQQK